MMPCLRNAIWDLTSTESDIERNVNNFAANCVEFRLSIDTGGMWCELLAPVGRVKTFYPSELKYVPLFGLFESNGYWYTQSDPWHFLHCICALYTVHCSRSQQNVVVENYYIVCFQYRTIFIALAFWWTSYASVTSDKRQLLRYDRKVWRKKIWIQTKLIHRHVTAIENISIRKKKQIFINRNSGENYPNWLIKYFLMFFFSLLISFSRLKYFFMRNSILVHLFSRSFIRSFYWWLWITSFNGWFQHYRYYFIHRTLVITTSKVIAKHMLHCFRFDELNRNKDMQFESFIAYM